ncbi:Uncharacterised protein [Mycobacteroides abscessus subsp. abscessus]|nr:Uncharacterised protein [Mycobacteroides abscessus subsp. abscessus]
MNTNPIAAKCGSRLSSIADTAATRLSESVKMNPIPAFIHTPNAV